MEVSIFLHATPSTPCRIWSATTKVSKVQKCKYLDTFPWIIYIFNLYQPFSWRIVYSAGLHLTNCIHLHLQSRAMGCANLSLFPVWVPNLRNLGRKMLGRSHVSPSNWIDVWDKASLERSGWVRHILLALICISYVSAYSKNCCCAAWFV